MHSGGDGALNASAAQMHSGNASNPCTLSKHVVSNFFPRWEELANNIQWFELLFASRLYAMLTVIHSSHRLYVGSDGIKMQMF